MRWTLPIHKTPEQREAEQDQALEQWHEWFASLPVTITTTDDTGKIIERTQVWLEPVMRRSAGWSRTGHGPKQYQFVYKLMEQYKLERLTQEKA